MKNIGAEVEEYRSCIFNYGKETLRFSTLEKNCTSFYSEATKLEEELESENLGDSRKQAFCSKLEQLLKELDSTDSEIIRIVKSDTATDWLTALSKTNDYHRVILKQYQRTEESTNQTSLVSSTSAGEKDTNETVIDTGNGEKAHVEENVGSLPGILLHTEAERNPLWPTRATDWRGDRESRSVRKQNFVDEKKNCNNINNNENYVKSCNN